jgi:(S)-2-hydroxy-acid oxidase/4-hydroxymandelate oxidase
MKHLGSTRVNTRKSIVKLDDFRTVAKARISPAVFDYIDCGACDEITNDANLRDFDEIKLVPLCLRDVSRLDLSAKIVGQSFDLPIGFSPTAFHKLVHEAGEVATATAAKFLKIPMIVSSMSSVTLEDIAENSGNDNLWFQIYIFKDRAITKSLVKRAERSGYKGIVITIGSPVVGKRDRNIVNRFSLPENISAANFKKNSSIVHNNPIHSFDGAELDPSVSWKDIEWLRCESPLPIILKGIMNPFDAAPALDLEVSGIIVSNHGGRQLDTTESTIRILPEMARAVSDRIPLLLDSGIRRGTDVLKAIALGADGVLLGRPVLWALAVDGQNGVVQAVNLLTEELRTAMQIAGCSSMHEVRKNSTQILRCRFNS